MSESRRSAPAAESDPFQVWREWVDKAERQINTALAEMMETERFSKSSGRMLDAMMAFQSTMSSATQRYFTTLNLPTRTDLLQVADRLSSIEERLALIEQTLQAVAPEGSGRRATASHRRPRRTKQPPADGDSGAPPVAAEPVAAAAAEEKPARPKAAPKKTAGKGATRKKAPARKKSPARKKTQSRKKSTPRKKSGPKGAS